MQVSHACLPHRCGCCTQAKRVAGRVTFNPGRVPGNDPKQPRSMLLVHFAKGDVDRLVSMLVAW